MPAESPKILLFDLDGTILTCGGAGQLAMERALTAAFGLKPPFANIPCAGRTDKGICGNVFTMFDIDDSPRNRLAFQDAYLEHLPKCLHERRARLLDGTKQLLHVLQRREDLLISVLTGNYQAAATIKLKHFSVSDYFQHGIFGDRHAERNRLAEDALDEFSKRFSQPLSGHHFLVIGDTPADVRCARAIGAKVIAVATGIHSLETLRDAEPDALFSDLSKVQDVIETIDRLFTD